MLRDIKDGSEYLTGHERCFIGVDCSDKEKFIDTHVHTQKMLQ